MKKSIAIVILLIVFSCATQAQGNKPRTGTQTHAKGDTSTMRGHGTDKASKDKVGPKGQVVYVATDARYYWVDKKGVRHYVEEIELKPKQ
jgi:hypothetical protein